MGRKAIWHTYTLTCARCDAEQEVQVKKLDCKVVGPVAQANGWWVEYGEGSEEICPKCLNAIRWGGGDEFR